MLWQCSDGCICDLYDKMKNNGIAEYRVDSIGGASFCINITTTSSMCSSKRDTFCFVDLIEIGRPMSIQSNYVTIPNFNGRACEIWQRMSNLIPHIMDVMTYPFWHLSNRGSLWLVGMLKHNDATLVVKYLEYSCTAILTDNYLRRFKNNQIILKRFSCKDESEILMALGVGALTTDQTSIFNRNNLNDVISYPNVFKIIFSPEIILFFGSRFSE